MADEKVPARSGLAGTPAIDYSVVPIELRARPQWVIWKRQQRKGKWTKVPYRAVDGRTLASATDPASWGTFDQAVARSGDAQGIGYVFSADDPYAGVDLDDCVDVETGELHEAAAAILQELGGYQERSPSGRGMHAIVIGIVPGDRRRTSDTPWSGVFEVYDQERYFTITGQGAGMIVEAQLDVLVARMFGPEIAEPERAGPARTAQDLIGEHPKLGLIVRREGAGPHKKTQSEWDLYLACECARLELTRNDFARLLIDARGDQKAVRATYVKTTWGKAQSEVAFEETDPAKRISRRYNLHGDNRIIRGETIGDIASGAAKVYLYAADGRRLRFPRLGDLFEAGKHTRIASQVTRSEFGALNGKEAVSIAQAIIALCGGDDADPLEEPGGWTSEFIAHAGATVEALDERGGRKGRWALFVEYQDTEQTLQAGRDPAARSAVIYDGEKDEWWLPAGALKTYSDSRRSGTDFIADMAEAGWRHVRVDLKEPSRAKRATGDADRIRRRFYVGRDSGEAADEA